MILNKIRRAQLIAPFGPGAMHAMKNGISVVTAGLDHWFKDKDGEEADITQIQKCKETVIEPRLAEMLDVDHFRSAPAAKNEDGKPNLVLPLLRFPSWYICPTCKHMEKESLSREGWIQCGNPKCKGIIGTKRERLTQVRFAAVCRHGHLQDFPWSSWVHRAIEPSCQSTTFKYSAKGSSSLEEITIQCMAENCSAPPRSLARIMNSSFNEDGSEKSYLSSNLEKGENDFLCQGNKIWLGEESRENCSQHLRAVLINSTNAHYAHVESAIYLPLKFSKPNEEEIYDLIKEPKLKSKIRMFVALNDGEEDPGAIAMTLKNGKNGLDKYDLGDITKAVSSFLGISSLNDSHQVHGDRSRQKIMQDIRDEEYKLFASSDEQIFDELTIRKAKIDTKLEEFTGIIDMISLVEKLRETRVFAGFSRLLANRPNDGPNPQRLLWDKWPHHKKDRWLPAASVQGEGIFLRLNENKLKEWESKEDVMERAEIIQKNYDEVVAKYGWENRCVSPRLLMMHSLAHLLINQLVFECGYGAASLRERLYVSNEANKPMSGIMIYTASGDSEGSMGGLVRMGKPDNMTKVLRNAISSARWCSADPVCGETTGQGPDSLNLAACHNCLLLPETSCELFNRMLDRNLVVGSPDGDAYGFFSEII